MAVVSDEVTEESSEDRAFRAEAQAWLADHAPAAVASGDAHAWQRELADGAVRRDHLARRVRRA